MSDLIGHVTKLIESKSYRVYREQKAEFIIDLVKESNYNDVLDEAKMVVYEITKYRACPCGIQVNNAIDKLKK